MTDILNVVRQEIYRLRSEGVVGFEKGAEVLEKELREALDVVVEFQGARKTLDRIYEWAGRTRTTRSQQKAADVKKVESKKAEPEKKKPKRFGNLPHPDALCRTPEDLLQWLIDNPTYVDIPRVRLAKKLHLSPQSVLRWSRQLIQAGMAEKVRHKDGRGFYIVPLTQENRKSAFHRATT